MYMRRNGFVGFASSPSAKGEAFKAKYMWESNDLLFMCG